MIYSKPQLVLMAEKAALDELIHPETLCALCDVASDWKTAKTEYDLQVVMPVDIWSDETPGDSVMKNTRWGLTQVLGLKARGYGYKGRLEGLIEPEPNLRIGAKILADYLRQAGGNELRALTLWYGQVGASFPALVVHKATLYKEFLERPERPEPLESWDTMYENA